MRIRWPLCESCGHGRASHAPERGGGWRCHYHGRKRKGERCECMRYRGKMTADGIPVDIKQLRELMSVHSTYPIRKD
ncbi:hypothetical protein J4U00_gp035 [Mycobacterium phage DyoEdafos]|uniref:Uncharacterized protein n=1 Tax=Mycobacterium phage DyoEdafos TaxID=2599860 RepID=A0A5J6TIZ7_9CAUD|nr:hypothetical protein J4U00_gp035 [Mycobacterium phage DyoEdafos]QFG10368.1 hypothetical protein SEA_DYOEDAFOS_35 [Mycobacterium phage DyoEdafos]